MPENLERRGNERYHIYDCQRCGVHIEKWVNVQTPPGYKYCNPCAWIVIDAALDRRDKNISLASSKV